MFVLKALLLVLLVVCDVFSAPTPKQEASDTADSAVAATESHVRAKRYGYGYGYGGGYSYYPTYSYSYPMYGGYGGYGMHCGFRCHRRRWMMRHMMMGGGYGWGGW